MSLTVGLFLLAQVSHPKVVNLRCEYLTAPLAVDVDHPRLSWEDTADTNGWVQTKYQILTASSPALLTEGRADLWDSGQVTSNETTQIEYAGRGVGAGSPSFWRVRVWDRDGNPSPWSSVAKWERGLPTEADWQKSEWIGRNVPAGANPAPYLRKTFHVDSRIKSARLYACGLGYADLHLNGQLVAPGAERDPAYTNFDKRVLYVAYDVTKLIHKGDNALGAILGTGWYDVHDRATWHFERAPWRGRPRLRAELRLQLENGTKQVIVSDPSWKATTGPILRDGIYTGEIYDARKEMPGWDTAKFDDSAWASADKLEAPKGKLAARVCNSVVEEAVIAPKKLTEPKSGTYIIDLGQNFAGHVRVKLNEPAGTSVTLRYSEKLDAKGMIERSQIEQFMSREGTPDPFQSDTYICKGKRSETWEQRFSYSGFRYVEVTGLTHRPSLNQFEGRFCHTDFESVGEFTCSDPMLNKLQQATRWSYLSNAQSIPTDCPQREKNGWTGDAQLAADAGLMNFGSATFYTKWLDDLADTESGDGMMSVIVPTGGWGRGARHPAWDSAYPIVANDLYLYKADTGVLTKHYEGLKTYVNSLATELKDGVLEFDSLGDWVPWSTQTPSQFTSTVYLYTDARILESAAKLQHNSEDAVHWQHLAEQVKDGLNRKWLNSETGTYANGSQTAQSMPLYFDLVPDKLRPAVFQQLVKNVESQGHIDTGILGAKYVIRVLTQHGRADLAYHLIARKEQPSWAWWIEQGATTLWEDWKGESSLNHIMFGDISSWFIQSVAGIGLDPAHPGFSNILFHPQPVGGLTWAQALYESPHGLIRSSWSKEPDGFHMGIDVPANTTGQVVLPYANATSEIGVPIASLPGVKSVKLVNNQTVIEVGSGAYQFWAKK